MTSLFTGAAVSATGYLAIIIIVPLIAEDVLGGTRWSGVPSAVAILGSAVGTTWISAVMARSGRRRGLLVGYGLSTLASLVGAGAAAGSLFPLLALAVFTIGVGYSANRLSRYAAADLYEPAHRARAIGWLVWAGTIGSVLGPLILAPTQRLGASWRLPDQTAPFLLATLTFGLSYLIVLFFLPDGGPIAGLTPRGTARAPMTPLARTALVALVIGQGVMVLIMTMTPIHIRAEGEGLDAIGYVIASHTFGMYALSPVSGFLSDRLGRRAVIVMASAFLIAAGLLAASSVLLTLALFLLGFGWNLSFVAGSALLTESTPEERRVAVQGFADSFVWVSAAVGGVLSGLVLSEVGFAALSYTGAAIAVIPALLVIVSRER